MFRGGPGAGPGAVCEAGEGSTGGGTPGPHVQRCSKVGPLHRSPHSECLLSRCRSEGESSRSIRYVCRRPLSVRLSVCPGQGGISETTCFPSL